MRALTFRGAPFNRAGSSLAVAVSASASASSISSGSKFSAMTASLVQPTSNQPLAGDAEVAENLPDLEQVADRSAAELHVAGKFVKCRSIAAGGFGRALNSDTASARSIMLSSPLAANVCALLIRAAALRPTMIFSVVSELVATAVGEFEMQVTALLMLSDGG